MHSVEAVRAYCKAVRELVRRLGVSDAEMERGQMRLEANISLRELKTQNSKLKTTSQSLKTTGDLPDYRVEIKNINSFRFLEGALKYEIERQAQALEKGEKLAQETRGYDAKKKVTFVQRSKEEAHDYRYFPEPDLPPLEISEEIISKVKDSLPKLRKELIDQLTGAYKLSKGDAEVLIGDKTRLQYFKTLVAEGLESQTAANLVINRPDVLLKTPKELVLQLQEQKTGEISDEDTLQKAVKSVISANPQPVKDYKAGKAAALQFLLGQVMRKTKGKANPKVVEKLLGNLLE